MVQRYLLDEQSCNYYKIDQWSCHDLMILIPHLGGINLPITHSCFILERGVIVVHAVALLWFIFKFVVFTRAFLWSRCYTYVARWLSYMLQFYSKQSFIGCSIFHVNTGNVPENV